MTDEEIRKIVKETMQELLASLGLDITHLQEVQADMLYLHKIRKGSEELPAKIKASLITLLVPTFLYVAWEAFKSKIMSK